MPEKPPRTFADHDHVRLGDGLEAGREVWRFTDDARGQIAHHDNETAQRLVMKDAMAIKPEFHLRDHVPQP